MALLTFCWVRTFRLTVAVGYCRLLDRPHRPKDVRFGSAGQTPKTALQVGLVGSEWLRLWVAVLFVLITSDMILPCIL